MDFSKKRQETMRRFERKIVSPFYDPVGKMMNEEKEIKQRQISY